MYCAEALVDLHGERLTAAYGFMLQNNVKHTHKYNCTQVHITQCSEY